MATLPDLHTALAKKSFEVVEKTEDTNRLRLVGRVPQDRMNLNAKNWLLVVDRLLEKSESAPWKVDVSRHYFRRGGTLVFAWRILIQGENVSQHYGDVIQVILGTPQTARGEITEFRLPGAGENRNESRRGRGATTIGSAPFVAPGRR